MKSILVTGGAGYIGSHTLRALGRAGYDPLCLDNLSTGYRSFADGFRLVESDLADRNRLREIFASGAIGAVVHFASHALVGESCENPHKYYRDNIGNALNLLEAMRESGVRYVVFSSSCSVYGVPSRVPIPESSPLQPINPYGATKMMVERILADYQRAHGLRFVVLRYFNAAGADPDGAIGEWHNPETHLIPRLLTSAVEGRAAEVYGNDYPTKDGTCIRDFIHVSDLAEAHVAAVRHLLSGRESDTFNLGTGQGHSVMEVVAQVRSCTGADLQLSIGPRRPGDPARLVADPGKAGKALDWSAGHSSLEEVVETAWNWHRKRSQ